MIRKYGLGLLALIGLVIALSMVVLSGRKTKAPPIPFAPPKPPYTSFIAGSGVVEASSENILIGTPFNEIATEVFVRAGDHVKKGTPLFQLDIRTFVAELNEAKARRAQAAVDYENQSTQLQFYDSLQDKRAVSETDYQQRFYAKETARVAIIEADTRIERAQTFIDRSTIRAPMDGEVLQVNIRPGETANLNPFNNVALITFGPVCPLHIRISIDEDDAWRFKPGMPAKAFVRGNSALSFPLQFVRVEPLIVPKRQLTGATVERVDTRVLQAIYTFDQEPPSIYVGQVMDVYVQGE